MLPTPTINSNSEEKFPKMASIRTFSPSVEKISFKLNEKRREKTNKRKQEAIIDRLENVLEEYQNELTTCKAEKETSENGSSANANARSSGTDFRNVASSRVATGDS